MRFLYCKGNESVDIQRVYRKRHFLFPLICLVINIKLLSSLFIVNSITALRRFLYFHKEWGVVYFRKSLWLLFVLGLSPIHI